jgi:hypothetical protein
MRPPQPIQKPAKSPPFPERRVRPGYETPAISAGAEPARAVMPSPKLAWSSSGPLAGFCYGVDISEALVQTAESGAYLRERPSYDLVDTGVSGWVLCLFGVIYSRVGHPSAYGQCQCEPQCAALYRPNGFATCPIPSHCE